MNRRNDRRPKAHVLSAAAASAVFAAILAGGLYALGACGRVDQAAAHHFQRMLGGETGALTPGLPLWAVAAGVVVFNFGLAYAMLSVAGAWRRAVLWAMAVTLTATWAPVLVLAARQPAVSGPVVAMFWAGLCAWFYARTHVVPADQS